MALIPGTTIPGTTSSESNGHTNGNAPIASPPGPLINGQQTVITLFTPSQLAQSKFMPSLKYVANEAFRQGHDSNHVLPSSIERAPSEQSILDELGTGLDTFTYIVHYADSDSEVVGTATMWRFTETPVLEAVGMTPEQLKRARTKATFLRHEPLPPGVEGWEMKLMAVNPNAQRQGLASTLINLCEAEAKRRVAASTRKPAINEVRFVLTCIEQINGVFYRKRGFSLDSQVVHPVGTLGSTTGFTVSHLSKLITL